MFIKKIICNFALSIRLILKQMKNSVFIAQNDRVQASKQASKPLLCTVTNIAHARAYNKIFDISKPAYEIFS